MFFLKIYIFKFYTFLSSVFEQLFLLNNKVESNLLLTGYERIGLANNNFNKDIFEKKIEDSKYFHRNIIKENLIAEFLKFIFFKNEILEYITKNTGYNFSIDFILAYSTLNIEKDNQNKAIYANHWHRDKPFSVNTLKIIIPLSIITNDYGPMEILSVTKSKFYKDCNIGDSNINQSYKLTGSSEDLFIFRPNVCYHRAGNPELGKIRSQIMLQLNPSKKWQFSKKLYEKQFKLEPKFPLFNLFEKKTKLFL